MLSNKAEQDMERTYGSVHVHVEGDLTFRQTVAIDVSTSQYDFVN